MIDLTLFKDMRIAVLGLGRSGLAAARALAAGGATVAAWDDGDAARAAAGAAGVPIVDLAAADPAGIDILVLSPGIPRRHPAPHPVVRRLAGAGVRIASDIDLMALARPDVPLIGITGTNGKSTTTALIGHVLAEAGHPVAVGGNLGTPALALDLPGPDGWGVLEVSSYQLETISLARWRIGVFLNISPDHLDRYAGMADYVAAKARLFAAPPASQTAVVGIDDDWSRRLYDRLATVPFGRRVVPISVEGAAPGGYSVRDGCLYDETAGPARAVGDLADAAALPGRHNWQNAAAAFAVARAAGVAEDAAFAAIRRFPGLAHRQQPVATLDGVRFVNDSKATNPDAAARALACWRPIFWIAGGRPKDASLDVLAPWLDRVAGTFLIGEAADAFARALDGRVTVAQSGTLDRAVTAAFAAARAHARRTGEAPVVLLSPACASFDQFASFEARGDAFIRLVQGLAGGAAAGTPGEIVRGAA